MIVGQSLLFGPIGIEVIIILFLIVFLFGANKIPKLARSIGKSTRELKKGREEVESEIEPQRDE